MADVAAVDRAVLATLSADAALTALCPDGVWSDQGPADGARFVVVQHQVHEDTEGFRGALYEQFFYRVTARVLSTLSTDADAAAFRIHQLLHNAPMTIDGYSHMATLREQRIKFPEVDARDRAVHWWTVGADYEIFVSPIN